MEKITKKLIVNFDPSQIFDTIELSSNFEKKYSICNIISSDNTNPMHSLQTSIKNRNILRRKPFLYKIQNAHLYGHSNLISTPDLNTSFLGLVFNLNLHKIFAKEVSRFKSLKDGIEVSYENVIKYKNGFFIGGSDNFGHWLFNCVGRLSYLEFLEPNIPIIVHDYLPKRFLDCISYFAKKNPIIKLPSNTLCLFEKLYVGTSSWYVDQNSRYWWSENTVKFLNENFTRNKNISGEKSIFLSRKFSNWRNILNEDLIINQLKKLNFEVLYIDTLSIKDQIEIALSSKNIISPLGASCCCFLFANHGTKCITLSPKIYSPMFLTDLYCGPLNQPHRLIYGSVVKTKNTSINSDYILDTNINWQKILDEL